MLFVPFSFAILPSIYSQPIMLCTISLSSRFLTSLHPLFSFFITYFRFLCIWFGYNDYYHALSQLEDCQSAVFAILEPTITFVYVLFHNVHALFLNFSYRSSHLCKLFSFHVFAVSIIHWVRCLASCKLIYFVDYLLWV